MCAVTGVADPSDDPDDLNLCVADADECSWFVGFATSPSALLWLCVLEVVACEADCAANAQVHQLTWDTRVN